MALKASLATRYFEKLRGRLLYTTVGALSTKTNNTVHDRVFSLLLHSKFSMRKQRFLPLATRIVPVKMRYKTEVGVELAYLLHKVGHEQYAQ